jgi:glutaredoxin-like protein NrdH
MKIIVYTKPGCVQCEWTIKLLDGMELRYEVIDVSLDSAAEQDVRNMVIDGKPVMGVPVVVVSNGKRTDIWVGFREAKIRGIRETGNY